MLALWFLAFLLILFYVRHFIKWKHGPPGPLPLPLVGNLVQLIMMGTQPHLAIAGLSKKYGDIFRLQIGTKDFVFASSIETLINLYSKDEALGRDVYGTLFDRSAGQNTGIIMAVGETWETNRKWTFKTLNRLGLRKGSGIEDSINEQCDLVVKSYETALSTSGTSWVALDVSPMFLIPVTKVVFRLVMGDRIDDADNGAVLEKLIHSSEEMVKSTSVGAGLDAAFPFLRFVVPKLTGRNVQMKCYTSMRDAAQKLLDAIRLERKSSSLNDDPKSLAHAYIQEIDNDLSNHSFSDFHFGSLYMDLLQAASDTTNSYLQCLLLFSVTQRTCQEKIYEEIVSKIGKCSRATLEHRRLMPYTESFMLETHRHSKIIPSLLPHKITKTFTIGKYTIPQDTQILADIHSVNFDERIWKNPKEFDPTRFLDTNGSVSKEKRKLCVPFGVGRRACPGESVAEWTAFIFLVNILRSFKLAVVPGESPPRTEMHVGIASGPYPFKVAISKREIN